MIKKRISIYFICCVLLLNVLGSTMVLAQELWLADTAVNSVSASSVLDKIVDIADSSNSIHMDETSITTFLPANDGVVMLESDSDWTNIALNGTAACVKDDGTAGRIWHSPENAIDNNTSTFYQAHDDNLLANLLIDLGDTYKISKICILSSAKNWPKSFRLEVSLDNENWQTVKEVMLNSAPTVGVYQEFTFSEADARYVRMDVTENGGSYAAAIMEFQVWANRQQEGEDLIDLALNGSASMDYPCYSVNNIVHPADHAIDGNYNSSTYAQSQDANALWSLTVDLRYSCEISRFKLETSNKNRATCFTIEISDDASTWTVVDTVTGFAGGVHTLDLSNPVQARYVRMHVTDIQTEGWGHTLFYFSVYGSYIEIDPSTVELGTLITDSNGFSITASSEEEGHSKDNVMDKSPDTYWAPSADAAGQHTLTIDLGNHHDLTGILVQGVLSQANVIQISTSEDNLRWYFDVNQLMLPNGAAIAFTQDYRRYVRITFPGDPVLQVSEIAFYGTTGNLPPVPTVTENTTANRPVLFPISAEVSGVQTSAISLNGTWNFSLEPVCGYWQDGVSREEWAEVTLPGDAFAQGYIPYSLAENDQKFQHESAFEKTIEIPADFFGKRVVLRVNGAINYARLWVNGELVRTHRSGKTSWDTDITDYVTPGQENRITIGLTCENPQVDFSRIRGITGDIILCALPEDYLSRLHVETDLDEDYNDADLKIQLGEMFHSEGNDAGTVRLTLTAPDGTNVPLTNDTVVLSHPGSGNIYETVVTNHINSPVKWDSEHPNLYTLEAKLFDSNNVQTEKVQIKVGFREITVTGTKVLVNGDAIKLRGANYTPSDPTLGVADNEEYHRKILVKLKAANVNFIRTAHCPRTEDFYALCDELGFYVESEASIFFIGMSNVSQINPDSLKNDSNYSDMYLNAISEMIEEYKSHPSILYWSLGNESNWGTNNDLCHTYARAADPTRPTKFSWGYNDNGIPEIYSSHYAVGASSSRPVIEDEYAHGMILPYWEKLDPGYQDCAENIVNLWERIYSNDNYLGGAIWAALDRAYYTDGKVNDKYNIANGNGWGFIDVWGREKPQYWNVKKAYSPFKILNETQVFTNPCNAALSIPVENRFNHSNLNECIINWNIGSESGVMLGPDVAKRTQGNLIIPARAWQDGDVLKLTITYQDVTIDEYALSIGTKNAPDLAVTSPSESVTVDAANLTVSGENFSVAFDSTTGMITSGQYDGKEILCVGPYLNLGIGSVGTWSKTSFDMALQHSTAVITLTGTYGGTINVTYVITIDSTGLIETSVNAQGIPSSYSELGVAYITPGNVESLSWVKNGYWSVYPEDHLGRSEGTALKEYSVGDFQLGEAPSASWSQDMKDYFLFGNNDQGNRGSKDFRSRKTNYYYATLNFDNGVILRAENAPAIQGVSNGITASARATVQSDRTIRFNLNTVWLQKNSFDGYNTPYNLPANGYTGTVKMRLMAEEH